MKDDYFILVYYGLPLIGLAITALAQLFIKTNYSKYKDIVIDSRERGSDVARKILDKHGLNNVRVEEVRGQLSDHYDPKDRVVRLSSEIYFGSSIASVAVAAHECGHAIQDKVGYGPMKIRSKLVPIVNITTKVGYFVVIIGLIFGFLNLAAIGIILLCAMLLFQLVTLPVEFNASKRGKEELKKLNVLNESETGGAAKMLMAAAFTYVAAVLSTLLQIIRLILMISSAGSSKLVATA